MRTLVTGGCGFIGSNFIRLLLTQSAMSVCNVDKLTYAGNLANLASIAQDYPDRYAFEHADIADKESMARIIKKHRIEAIINFAAETHVDRSIIDPTPFLATNIIGTQTLLTVAKEAGIQHFVHVSTDEVYGALGPDGKFTEQTPLAPNSPYSASKASADLLCRAWYETYNYPVIITRCSNNYGPYQFPEKLIPLMYTRAARGEALPVYGDGCNVRDWIHVDDHCQGVLLALQKGKPGAIYNLGGDAERDNLTVVKAILAYCNQPESLISFVTDRPGHDKRYAMNFALAARELGFAPTRTFEQGLRETLDWYATHTAWVNDVTSGAYLAFMRQWYGEKL